MSHAHPPEGETTRDPADDATLGGYLDKHDRPPAFEGSDGHPYTVSMEADRTGDLRKPYLGYLVFPRWAETGVGIIGHRETPTLSSGVSKEEALGALRAMSLHEVQAALERAIGAARETADD
jgi:hypothetical protein